jgi:hypothetical protein
VVFVVAGHRRRALRAPFAVLGSIAVMAAVAAAGALAALGWAIGDRLHPEYALIQAATPVLGRLYLAAWTVLGVASAAAVQASLRRRLSAVEIFAGGMLFFGALAMMAAFVLPGGAYLFTWPVLAALPFAFAAWTRSDPDAAFAVSASLAASAPAPFLLGPLPSQLLVALGPGVAPVVAATTALVTAAAAPAVRLLIAPAPRAVPLAALGIAAALCVAAGVHPTFDRDHPRPDTVIFAVDADHGRAFWLSPDPTPPPWPAALAGASRGAAPLPFPIGDVLAAPASAVPEPGPEIVWIADRDLGPAREGRSLEIRVLPPPGAELIAVHVGGLASARVEGRVVPLLHGALDFRFHAPPAAGVQISVETAAGRPIVVRAASQRAGFLVQTAPSLGERPPDRMAKSAWDPLLESDRTLVVRSATR